MSATTYTPPAGSAAFPDLPAGYDAWRPDGHGGFTAVKYPHAAVYKGNVIPLRTLRHETLDQFVDSLGWDGASTRVAFVAALKAANPHSFDAHGRIVGDVLVPVFDETTRTYGGAQ